MISVVYPLVKKSALELETGDVCVLNSYGAEGIHALLGKEILEAIRTPDGTKYHYRYELQFLSPMYSFFKLHIWSDSHIAMVDGLK